MFDTRIRRVALALGTVTAIAACDDYDSNKVLGPRLTGANAIFQNYVALGNSITAGYQSSGINDATQKQSYAVLLASQMGVRFAYPSLAGRGCAPPVVNFQTQQRFGHTAAAPVTSSTCDLRNPSATDLLNNVAVPGAAVIDLTAASSPNSNTLTSLFLSGKTQVEKALQTDPTFASIWIGNNDVLPAAVAGVLVPLAGVSPGVTAQGDFEAAYNAATDQLIAGAPGLEGVLVGVVNVSSAPLFFQVGVLQASVPAFQGFDQASGWNPASGDPVKAAPMTIDPNCSGAAAATLVSFRIASEIARFRNDTNATGQPPKDPTTRVGHPAHIACGTNTVGYPATVGEVFILTTGEQTTLANAVAGYNAFIQSEATALDWAYMNPNVVLDSLRTAGEIPSFPNLASATATFGAWFSLDGAHPSAQGHRGLTNHLIDAINAKYGTTLNRISVP